MQSLGRACLGAARRRRAVRRGPRTLCARATLSRVSRAQRGASLERCAAEQARTFVPAAAPPPSRVRFVAASSSSGCPAATGGRSPRPSRDAAASPPSAASPAAAPIAAGRAAWPGLGAVARRAGHEAKRAGLLAAGLLFSASAAGFGLVAAAAALVVTALFPCWREASRLVESALSRAMISARASLERSLPPSIFAISAFCSASDSCRAFFLACACRCCATFAPGGGARACGPLGGGAAPSSSAACSCAVAAAASQAVRGALQNGQGEEEGEGEEEEVRQARKGGVCHHRG
mmetsp:Transcript_31826/g.94592  ORF Transcript_31826/g.94592 Transcript_31826/m.94592 type:complete len:292 (+) Transcript_31826:316-1191(+)